MAVFPKLKVKTPKMAHHPLSHFFRTSMAPGALYPIYVRPMAANETFPFNVESLVNTQALLSPLYGSYKLKIMAFFAGTSLYCPKLWRNGSMKTSDGTLDASYPTFHFLNMGVDNAPFDFCVNGSSLMAYLGFGHGFYDYSGNQEFNAIPLLMYWDIFRNYFANRQEEIVPTYLYNGSTVVSNPTQLAALDQLFLNLPADGGNINSLLGSTAAATALAYPERPLAGFAYGTYMPDRMNVILNSSFYEKNVTSVQVSTTGDSFQVDQLVTAKKLWNSRNKDAMTNGTFKDWVRSHFGVTPKIMDDMPTFLGATSSDVNFEDIRATTYAQNGEQEQFLGDKSSSGLSYGSSRRFVCKADRPGFLMVLAQLVPRVDYYQFTHRYVLSTKLSDEFRPEFNNIGLQDVLISDLNTDSSDISISSLSSDQFALSVGKQPAWIDLMTEVNEIRGTFCTTEKSWVLARDMRADPLLTNDVPDNNTDTSAYILPADWNQPFALQSPTDQNFLVQFYIDGNVRSTVLKRLLPKF